MDNFAKNCRRETENDNLSAVQRKQLEQNKFRIMFKLVKLRGKVAKEDNSFESDSSDYEDGRIEPENEDRPRSHRFHPLLCLAKTDKISKEIRSLERDVWMIEGILKHEIRRELLELI